MKYNQGRIFDTNATFAAYIFLIVGIGITGLPIFSIIRFSITDNHKILTWAPICTAFIIGFPFLLLALFILLTKTGIEINIITNTITEYNNPFGIFKTGKKINPLNDYKFISIIPTKLSSTAYSRSGNSSTNTSYFHSITIFKEGLKGKIEIIKYSSYKRALEESKEINSVLNLEYFNYSPSIARQIILNR